MIYSFAGGFPGKEKGGPLRLRPGIVATGDGSACPPAWGPSGGFRAEFDRQSQTGSFPYFIKLLTRPESNAWCNLFFCGAGFFEEKRDLGEWFYFRWVTCYIRRNIHLKPQSTLFHKISLDKSVSSTISRNWSCTYCVSMITRVTCGSELQPEQPIFIRSTFYGFPRQGSSQ